MYESYFCGRRIGNRRRGIGEEPSLRHLGAGRKSSGISCSKCSRETLLTRAFKKVKRGNLIYTDKFRRLIVSSHMVFDT